MILPMSAGESNHPYGEAAEKVSRGHNAWYSVLYLVSASTFLAVSPRIEIGGQFVRPVNQSEIFRRNVAQSSLPAEGTYLRGSTPSRLRTKKSARRRRP